MKKRTQRRRGSSLIEFTFVGIPMMFILISVFEMSRGMWMYHTLAYSVKQGVRVASVHGINCVTATNNPNNCTKTMAEITQVIRDAAVGLNPVTGQTMLTFKPGAGGVASTQCALDGTTGACTGVWPPNDATGASSSNSVGKPITIEIRTVFRSAISMFWPGARPVTFGTVTLGASSTDYIQF